MAKGDPGGMGQSGGNAYGGFFRPNPTSQMGGSIGGGQGSGMNFNPSSIGGSFGGGPFSAIGQMAGQAGMGMGGGQQQPMNRTGIGPSMRPGGGGFSETGGAQPMIQPGQQAGFNPMAAAMASHNMPQTQGFNTFGPMSGAVSQIGQLAGQAGMNQSGQMAPSMPQQGAGPSDDMVQKLLGGMQKQGV